MGAARLVLPPTAACDSTMLSLMMVVDLSCDLRSERTILAFICLNYLNCLNSSNSLSSSCCLCWDVVSDTSDVLSEYICCFSFLKSE